MFSGYVCLISRAIINYSRLAWVSQPVIIDRWIVPGSVHPRYIPVGKFVLGVFASL